MIVGACALWLVGCTSNPIHRSVAGASKPSVNSATRVSPAPASAPPVSVSAAVPTGQAINQTRSRWVAVSWAELPGFSVDSLAQAWSAWLKSCEQPNPAWAALCKDVRTLSLATEDERRAWMQSRLQPFRVETLQGESTGLLTSYYEPIFDASRTPTNAFVVPLFQAPADLNTRKPWFSRQEIDTLPEAKAALQGRVIAYMTDPVEAMMLQIQGSGRMRVMQTDGSVRTSRLAYAGTNEQPYKSIGRWLLDQGLIKDSSWPGIKAWVTQNPNRVQELLWSNPRVVFFQEEPLSDLDASFGPRGAQGVALTAGRSIAVDPGSVPYGTPVWMVSAGVQTTFEKLVFAQDTGAAITGAVRADYFAGWGPQAGELAGRLKQPLQMWVLWPKPPN